MIIFSLQKKCKTEADSLNRHVLTMCTKAYSFRAMAYDNSETTYLKLLTIPLIYLNKYKHKS